MTKWEIFFYIYSLFFLLYKFPDMFFTFNLAFNYYNDVMSSEELTDLSPVFILSL